MNENIKDLMNKDQKYSKRKKFDDNERKPKEDGVETTKDPNKRKKRIVLFYGQDGSQFLGSARNKQVKTVEFIMFETLQKCGLVSEDNTEDYAKIGFESCSRTDKGVHAMCNFSSCKILVDKEDSSVDIIDYLKSVRDVLNDNLKQKEIRIYSIKPVTKNFSTRLACSSRLYYYLIPVELFECENVVGLLDKQLNKQLGKNNFRSFTKKTHKADLDTNKTSRHIFECEVNDQFSYKVDCEEFNSFLTDVHKQPNSQDLTPSEMAKYGIEIENSSHIQKQPISNLTDCTYTSFICIKIRGESFLYHMIRKMIGLVIQCILNGKEPDQISVVLKSFKDEDLMHVPLAPAEGLLLVSPQFTQQDNRRDIPCQLVMDDEENKKQKDQFNAQLKNRLCYEVNSTQCFQTFKNMWVNEPKLYKMSEKLSWIPKEDM